MTLARHWWAFALIVLLMSVVATMVVVGMVNFLGVTRDIQLDLLAGDVDAGTLALLRLTFQLGVPGFIILGLIASSGFGALTVLADQVLAGTPRRIGVAFVHGIRRSIISFLTAAIAIAVVIALILGAPVVSILGIIGLIVFPLLRNISRKESNSRVVVAARALSLRRLFILAVPLGAAVTLAVGWTLAFAVSVFEPGGPISALRTSRDHMRGRGAAAVVAITVSVLLSMLLQAGIGLLVGLMSAEAAVLVQGAVQLLIAPLAFIVIVAILRSGRTAATAHDPRPDLPRVKSLVGIAAVLSVTLVATLLVVPGAPAYADAPISTTLQVTTSPNPSSPGQEVTITVTVVPSTGTSADISGGSMMVRIDGVDTPLEMGVSEGVATNTTTNFPAGVTTSFTAEYGGNGAYSGSTITAEHEVNAASGTVATTATISSDSEPSRYGIAPTFTARVTSPAGAPLTGNFMPSGGLQSTLTVDGTAFQVWVDGDGIASLTVNQVPEITVGSHTISFDYPGNGYFDATSAIYTHIVAKTGTTSSAVVTPLSPRTGENYSISVTVAPGAPGLDAPSGDVTVALSDGNTLAGTLVNGAATISTTAPLASGELTYSMNYSGDGFYEASSNVITADIVDRYPTTTTLNVAPLSTDVGDAVRLTATVEADLGAGIPPGSVRFNVYRSGYPGYSEVVALVNGVAEHDFTPHAVSLYTVTAEYMGVTDFAGSTSATVDIDSVRTNPTLTLTADTPSTVRGEQVTFTVTAVGVPGLTATGDVTISGAGPDKTLTLNGIGSATFTTSTLAAGIHTVTASYAGDQTYLAAVTTVDHEVAFAASAVAVTTTWSTPWTNAVWGQSVTVGATVRSLNGSGPTPSGSLEFQWVGGSQTVAVNASGRAELVLATLPVGAGTITAQYVGDGYYLGSSDDLAITVDKAVTSVLLLASNSAPVVGEPVNYTATVSTLLPGGGVPTGSVSFSAPYADTVTVPLDANGVASVVMPTNAAISPYIVVAAFSGDSNTFDAIGEFRPAVSKGSSSLVMTTSATTAPLGNSIDLIVTAVPTAPSQATPTGSLRVLRDGGWVFAVQADASGVTVIPMDIAWLGDKIISVELISDNYTAPNSNAATITGTAFTPLLSLTTNGGSALAGDPVTLTARIDTPDGFSLDGEISFYDGATLLGTQWISGRAQTILVRLESFVTSSLTAGTHQLHAEFTSNVARSTDATSTNSPITIGVLTATTHIVNPDHAKVGAPIEWLVSVTSPNWSPGNLHRDPTGSVELYVDSVLVGTGALGTPASGRAFATISTPAIAAGAHAVEARFVPTSMHSPSNEMGNLIVYSSESLMVITGGNPTVLWGDTLSYSVSVEPRTGTWPTPTGNITVLYDDNSLACTLPATGGNCAVSWSTPGNKSLSFSYQGDATHGPVTGARNVTVNKRTPVMTTSQSDTRAISGDPITMGWDVVGPIDGTVMVSTTGGVNGCTSTTLQSQCDLVFPLGVAGSTMPVAITYGATTHWNLVSVTRNIPVVGCYPVTLTVAPAGAGTLTANRAPECNAGAGYIGGSALSVTAAPAAESDPSFDWEFSGFQPGTASGTPDFFGTSLDIVVGPRLASDISAGPTNWVRADFSKTFFCFTVQAVAVTHKGGTGRLDLPAPNCPVDASGTPVSVQKWVASTEQVGIASVTTRTGRVLAGTVVSPVAVPGNAESETYGYSNTANGAWPLQSVPEMRADRPGLVSRALFGPKCHALDLQAQGPGELVPVTSQNCHNPLTGANGWTAGTDVNILASAKVRWVQAKNPPFAPTYIPSYVVDWQGAATDAGVSTLNEAIRFATGERGTGLNDQTNTVKVLGTARSSTTNQAVTVNFRSCVMLTLKTTMAEHAKGSVALNTAGNCPNYDNRSELFMPGTAVSISATTIDYVRKAIVETADGSEKERNSYIFTYFGGWSDGSTKDDHSFPLEEDTVLTASFWYKDRSTGVRSCAPIELTTELPSRTTVGLTEFYLLGTESCPQGNLAQAPSDYKYGYYSTKVDPDRPGRDQSELLLTAADTATDSSTVVGWKYDVFASNSRITKGYSAGETLSISGAASDIYAKAMLCERLDTRVMLTNDKGEKFEEGVPEDSKLVMVSPAPNCPFDKDAWLLGTTVQVGAFGNPVGYAFAGWTGEADNTEQITPVLLDGIRHKTITARYTVTCFTLELPLRNTGFFSKISGAVNGPSVPNYERSDVTRYPEPNCPGYPASTGLYAGGTNVSLYGKVASNKVWQGWVGDMIQPGKVNPVTVIMDANKSATHRWRDRNTGEDIVSAANDVGDAFVSIGDDVAIYAKKMTAVMALIMVEVVKWMPPMGVVNAILATAALVADLAVLAGASKGSVEFLKAGQKIMDFMLSGISCAATWGFNGNGSQNMFAPAPSTPARSGDFGDKSAEEQLVDIAKGTKAAKTTYGFVSAARSGYAAAKLFAIEDALGGTLGVASPGISSAISFGSMLINGGLGWDSSAKSAWTDGSAYSSCLAGKVPNL